ncbi:hypothetical protein [Actinomadura sp. DC4]|uniref:hypothetical protein n=1 Tax=Actinomadura sp. DC4 TaxID=3055069 RepID=UPI0025AF4896|nr:hypothetical protein [Actinomadura sp. DC4]MDN3356394.1 hypothetical protein [Actinomadura sp. DC4]
MRGRVRTLAALALALVAVAVLGGYLWLVGLDAADKLASVVGLFVAIAGLGIAVYGLFADRRAARREPAQVSATGDRSAAVGGDNRGIVSTGDGAVNTITNTILKIPRAIQVAVVVLTTAALLTEGGWIVVKWVVPQLKPIYKTQFLVDTTAGAGVDGPAAIADSLKSVVANAGSHDALALRSFGGECGTDGNTTQLVGFGTGNATKITKATGRIRVGGQATLVRGIVEAAQDFSKPFSLGARQVNRIIVVTRHGTDACDSDASYVENEIRERIGSAHLGIEFRLVGYQVPDNQRDTLQRIATGAKAPEPAYADSPAKLSATLNWFANVEPVLRNAKKIVDILNPAVDLVNSAVKAIEDDRLDIASRDLGRARGAIDDTDTAFEDLQGRTKTPAERDIHARAARLRSRQRRVVAAAGDLLDAARSGAPEDPRLTAFRQVATGYNTEVNAMNQALARLRATFPS